MDLILVISFALAVLLIAYISSKYKLWLMGVEADIHAESTSNHMRELLEEHNKQSLNYDELKDYERRLNDYEQELIKYHETLDKQAAQQSNK